MLDGVFVTLGVGVLVFLGNGVLVTLGVGILVILDVGVLVTLGVGVIVIIVVGLLVIIGVCDAVIWGVWIAFCSVDITALLSDFELLPMQPAINTNAIKTINITPLIGALLMIFSSLSVILLSLTIKNFKLR